MSNNGNNGYEQYTQIKKRENSKNISGDILLESMHRNVVLRDMPLAMGHPGRSRVTKLSFGLQGGDFS